MSETNKSESAYSSWRTSMRYVISVFAFAVGFAILVLVRYVRADSIGVVPTCLSDTDNCDSYSPSPSSGPGSCLFDSNGNCVSSNGAGCSGCWASVPANSYLCAYVTWDYTTQGDPPQDCEGSSVQVPCGTVETGVCMTFTPEPGITLCICSALNPSTNPCNFYECSN
jgi:hypothetical protein